MKKIGDINPCLKVHQIRVPDDTFLRYVLSDLMAMFRELRI